MNPSYRHDKDHNYMILEASEKLGGHEYQVRMLLLNEIPGLLKCNMRMLDGHPAFYYEITSKQPLSRAFEKVLIGKENIKQLLLGIETAFKGAKKYLLDVNHFLLNPEYVYMDVETGQISLCCLPFYEGEISTEFHQLAEYILKRLDHNDAEAVLWGYEIYSSTVKENYSLDQILQSVYQKNTSRKEVEETEKIEAKTIVPDIETNTKCRERDDNGNLEKGEIKKRFDKKSLLKVLYIALSSIAAGILLWAVAWIGDLNLTQIGGIIFLLLGLVVYFTTVWGGFQKPDPKRKKSKKDKGHSTIYEYMEISETEEKKEEEDLATTILHTGTARDSAILISMNPDVSENIVLYKKSHVLGKLKSQVDIPLGFPEISRMHAKIEQKEDSWYLTDLNSRNGTFINGIRLKGEESRKIKTLDTIYFASCGYYFK